MFILNTSLSHHIFYLAFFFSLSTIGTEVQKFRVLYFHPWNFIFHFPCKNSSIKIYQRNFPRNVQTRKQNKTGTIKIFSLEKKILLHLAMREQESLKKRILMCGASIYILIQFFAQSCKKCCRFRLHRGKIERNWVWEGWEREGEREREKRKAQGKFLLHFLVFPSLTLDTFFSLYPAVNTSFLVQLKFDLSNQNRLVAVKKSSQTERNKTIVYYFNLKRRLFFSTSHNWRWRGRVRDRWKAYLFIKRFIRKNFLI